MNRLKDLREDMDLTQTDIAKILNTKQEQVSKWENGIQQMGIDKYITLAKFYNVSIDYLAGIIPQPRTLDGSPYHINQAISINESNERRINNLKALREDRGITQTDIARLLKTTHQQVYKWENGVQQMGIDKYITLAKFYNVSIDYLAGIIPKPRTLDGSPYSINKTMNINDAESDNKFTISSMSNSTHENNMIFFENIKKLCAINGISVTALGQALGLSNATTAGWRKGSQPRGKTLKMIADYFNVTVDQLIDHSTITINDNHGIVRTNHADVTIINGTERELSKQEIELLNIFEHLSVIDQAKLLIYAEELKEKNNGSQK